jgi:hypothetical protein
MKWVRGVVWLALVSLEASAASPAGSPSWSKAEADLRASWGKSYNGEKPASVTKDADDVALLEKTDAAGKVVERKLKFAFKVVVKKASGTMAYEAGANYIQDGKSWKFSEIGIGDAQAIGGASDRPEKLLVKAMALKAFAEKDATYTWSNLKIDDGELGRSGDRRWVRYEGDVDRTDGDGVVVTCRDLDFTITRRGGGDWSVSVASMGRCY